MTLQLDISVTFDILSYKSVVLTFFLTKTVDVSYYRKKKENLSKHHQLLENFVLLQIYKIINVYLQK